jgi:hypothetical protein
MTTAIAATAEKPNFAAVQAVKRERGRRALTRSGPCRLMGRQGKPAARRGFPPAGRSRERPRSDHLQGARRTTLLSATATTTVSHPSKTVSSGRGLDGSKTSEKIGLSERIQWSCLYDPNRRNGSPWWKRPRHNATVIKMSSVKNRASVAVPGETQRAK